MRLKINKPLAIAGVVTTVGLASVTGIGIASAQSTTSDSSSGASSLIDKLASKFNLNKDEVKAVFDQEKSDRDAEMQAKLTERLDAAVKDGKITAEQKTLIENKLKELKSSRENERAELDKWASDNKIDAKYLMMGGPRGDDASERLQTAVDNGEITADQKSLIEKKQAELKSQRESNRTALEKWASDNKIDSKYLMMFGGRGHGGPGGPEGRGGPEGGM